MNKQILTHINFQALEKSISVWITQDGLKIIFIVLLAAFTIKLVKVFTKKLMTLHVKKNENPEYYKKIQTLHSISMSVTKTIVIVISAMLILQQLGINIGPILAAAGVLGIAIGLGSQKFVEDIIGGIIILLHDQIRVGDIVQIGDKSGLVEKITLNMVTLRDNWGNVHFIRTGKLDVITNTTKDFSYYVFNVGISYDQDVEKVMGVLKDLGEDLQKDPAFSKDILAPIEVLGIEQLAESSVVIQARIKTRPVQQWSVGREFNHRMKNKFDELGIQMSFAQKSSTH